MPVMIYKPSRRQNVDGRQRVITKHEQWYIRDTGKDFHTKYGVIKKSQLKQGVIKLKNETFYVVPANFLDLYKGMKRRAQIITRKDIGFIIGYCGLTKNSVVVESGAGSGGATLLLSQLCKKVFSYEIDKENIEITKYNLEDAGCRNVSITKTDFCIKENVKKHNADLVLLDLPEPWQAYDSVLRTLQIGGYVVAYTPTIIQAQRFVENLPENFLVERTVEVIDRDWKIQGQAVRPVSGDIGHTAFLTFARRVL